MKNLIEFQEERVSAILEGYKELTFIELQKFLHDYFTAKKNTNRSSELAMKRESTVKQRIRHATNCEDLEFKRLIVQGCINYLSDCKTL